MPASILQPGERQVLNLMAKTLREDADGEPVDEEESLLFQLCVDAVAATQGRGEGGAPAWQELLDKTALGRAAA
jgi:hypothetical protein